MTISIAATSTGNSPSFYALWTSTPNADDGVTSSNALSSSDDNSADLSSDSGPDPLAQAIAAALNSLGTTTDGDISVVSDDTASDGSSSSADTIAALQQFLGSLFQAAAQQSGTASVSYTCDLASAVSGLAQSSSTSNSALASNYQNLLDTLGVQSDDPLEDSAPDLQQFLATLAGNLQAQGASSSSGLFIDTSV
ncbi:hypothetical protein G3N59_20780 [Paraburkholderia sp. Ac-20340]|uniref:hypothetical protein n=1 Tax=Paraburkholderia sp. Ac-20340 TaxID=2703888 RepID=UPI0019810D4A|nr:hypothetical protein [Paraburkholderia sp. Ac-20340]MBN3855817.1 hypothetical protein [Paraburkholderia sp. Ac-20340]